MTSLLTQFSDQLADAVDAAAASVVQVQGSRRPASGVVVAADTVLTTGRALGRETDLHVRTPDGRVLEAELAGWDPATHLVVLRAEGLNVQEATAASDRPRVGQIAIAIGRSWSNAVTATLGNVAVIGGPLPTGCGRAIDEVIRTTAPMHQGFAGGALVNPAGHVIGVATAAEIRGLGVAIPAAIAWKAAQDVIASGQVKRGYLGVAGQAVRLPDRQRTAGALDSGLLVVGVTADSPAERAGLIVGDIVIAFDGVPVDSADRLIELLAGDRVGRAVPIGILRGGSQTELSVTVEERKG